MNNSTQGKKWSEFQVRSKTWNGNNDNFPNSNSIYIVLNTVNSREFQLLYWNLAPSNCEVAQSQRQVGSGHAHWKIYWTFFFTLHISDIWMPFNFRLEKKAFERYTADIENLVQYLCVKCFWIFLKRTSVSWILPHSILCQVFLSYIFHSNLTPNAS